MSPSSDALGRLSEPDSEEDNTMILNAPPTLLRSTLTQPVDSANLHPYDMAAWWLVGRAEQHPLEVLRRLRRPLPGAELVSDLTPQPGDKLDASELTTDPFSATMLP